MFGQIPTHGQESLHPNIGSVAQGVLQDGELALAVCTAVRSIDTILSAHGARYQSYPDLLGRVADAFDATPAGQVKFQPTQDCFGGDHKEAAFNDFSIVVPLDYTPSPGG